MQKMLGMCGWSGVNCIFSILINCLFRENINTKKNANKEELEKRVITTCMLYYKIVGVSAFG